MKSVSRSSMFKFVSILVAVVTLLVYCAAPSATIAARPSVAAAAAGQAKYIFLFIGDGMAVAQRNAAELFLAATQDAGMRPEAVKLLMNQFPAQGMTTTYDLSSIITDSASAGTALATGHKTLSGVLNMVPASSRNTPPLPRWPRARVGRSAL